MTTLALEEIITAIGPSKVRKPGEIPQRNWSDATGLVPVEPLALILPEATEDVATALAICHRHGQPVVIQGGLTGLAAAPIPTAAKSRCPSNGWPGSKRWIPRAAR